MTRADELQLRSKEFALRIIKLYRYLKRSAEGRVIGGQVLRSGTSEAANYRSACRARSHAEFISRMGVVVEEADETVFWLELVVDSSLAPPKRMEPLLTEARELLNIFSASRGTARRR